MRQRGAWAGVLLCAAAAGCFTRPGGSHTAARPDGRGDPVRARSFAPTPAVEGPYVESVLLEQPVGDPFLDHELWACGTAPLRPDTRALLAENGLRVVLLGGNLPPAFQKLLTSEADTVNPHGLTFANRKDAVIPTAGPTDPCEYEVLTDLAGARARVALRQAGGGVLVRPEPAGDGRVRVWCEPQVQHGDRQQWLRPTADGTQFVVQGEVPAERYPGLGFEVPLAPTDYLLIGWPAGAAGTLGSALFGVEANGRPRQRVLVIRAGRLGEAPPADLPTIPNMRGRPSIAAEASRR